jgi:hypothetical protein
VLFNCSDFGGETNRFQELFILSHKHKTQNTKNKTKFANALGTGNGKGIGAEK